MDKTSKTEDLKREAEERYEAQRKDNVSASATAFGRSASKQTSLGQENESPIPLDNEPSLLGDDLHLTGQGDAETDEFEEADEFEFDDAFVPEPELNSDSHLDALAESGEGEDVLADNVPDFGNMDDPAFSPDTPINTTVFSKDRQSTSVNKRSQNISPDELASVSLEPERATLKSTLSIKAASSADRKNDLSNEEPKAKKERKNEVANDDEFRSKHHSTIEAFRQKSEAFGGFRSCYLAGVIEAASLANPVTPGIQSHGDAEYMSDIEFTNEDKIISLSELNASPGDLVNRKLESLVSNCSHYSVIQKPKIESGGSSEVNKLLDVSFNDVSEPTPGFDVKVERANSLQSEVVDAHLKVMAKSMLLSGLDEFELAGSDSLKASFAASIKEAAKELGVEYRITDKADSQTNELDNHDDPLANQSDFSKLPWIEQSSGFRGLSNEDKEKAQKAYSEWVQSDPKRNTYSLESYVSYVQEKRQEEQADNSYNSFPSP